MPPEEVARMIGAAAEKEAVRRCTETIAAACAEVWRIVRAAGNQLDVPDHVVGAVVETWLANTRAGCGLNATHDAILRSDAGTRLREQVVLRTIETLATRLMRKEGA